MRVGTPGFVPGRLTEAREARRIPSMSALARHLSINSSTISRWEDGTSSPDPAALAQLASTLGVRSEFFLRPLYATGRPMFLRSLSSALVRDLAYQRSQMRWLQEISSIVQHYADLPAVNVPNLLGGASYRQLESEDLEQIALDLRKHWKIGDGPCGDMVGLLERNGFVVASIEMSTARLDGLCSWAELDERPHVLLANDKASFPRRQMDAAHEMAHAILHREVPEEELQQNLKFIEAQAFRLASSFLLPSTSYPLEVKTASLAVFTNLKERWRVSIKAQIKRIVDLELIGTEFAQHLYKLYSAKGWAKEEPLDKNWSLQDPRILSDALHLIVESGTRSKADLLATEFTMTPGDVENLCSLAAGWFSRESADIVRLKPVPTLGSDRADSGATIVPFPKPK